MPLLSKLKIILPQAIWPSQCAHRTLNKIYETASILGGPFRSMKYISEAQGSVLVPKLLGIYEKELQPVINNLTGKSFDSIYVIGAGEGYYAVGMALKLPKARIFAYEANESAHRLIREVAGKNGVAGRVSILGLCSEDDMRAIPTDSLVIMDVEGAEEHLLNPEKFSGLLKSTILFEAHQTPEETQTLILEKFNQTHSIFRIDSEDRVWKDIRSLPFPLLFYIRRNIGFWLDEMRGCSMQWYLLTPKIFNE
jgi:precorrin-6B methylase 2